MAKSAFCPRCGAATGADDHFCKGCALNLMEAESQRHTVNDARQKRGNVRQQQILYLVLVVIVVAGYFALHH